MVMGESLDCFSSLSVQNGDLVGRVFGLRCRGACSDLSRRPGNRSLPTLRLRTTCSPSWSPSVTSVSSRVTCPSFTSRRPARHHERRSRPHDRRPYRSPRTGQPGRLPSRHRDLDLCGHARPKAFGVSRTSTDRVVVAHVAPPVHRRGAVRRIPTRPSMSRSG